MPDKCRTGYKKRDCDIRIWNMKLRLCKKGVKLQKDSQFRHAGLRSPKRAVWHLLSNSVIPDLIRNLQTLFQDIFMQNVEIPHQACLRCRFGRQVRDDALFELQHRYITKFSDLISSSRYKKHRPPNTARVPAIGWSLVTACLFLIMLMFLSGCEDTFEPLQDNDRYHFSIYGYLDATADTNWVRVMPVRDAIYAGPEPVDAVVTLKHLETGSISVMNDSLFQFGSDVHARNFWTTKTLIPGDSYRLTAENSSGQSSSATITLPPDYSTPEVQQTEGDITFLYIDPVEQLVDLQVIYAVFIRQNDQLQILYFPVSQLENKSLTDNGYFVTVNRRNDHNYINQRLIGRGTIQPVQVFAASAGPDWVDFSVIDDEIIELPEGISNIENGVGYLTGIVSKTVPFRTCFDENGNRTACPLEPRVR